MEIETSDLIEDEQETGDKDIPPNNVTYQPREIVSSPRPGFDQMGFDPFKKIKKAAGKIDWKKVKAVAQTVGPAIATAYPPAAPAMAVALPLLNAAAKKDPKALAKIAAMKAAAAIGDETAQSAIEALGAAQQIKRFNDASRLVKAVAEGSPEAADQVRKLQALAPDNPEAAKALELVRNATVASAAVNAAESRSGGSVTPFAKLKAERFGIHPGPSQPSDSPSLSALGRYLVTVDRA